MEIENALVGILLAGIRKNMIREELNQDTCLRSLGF